MVPVPHSGGLAVVISSANRDLAGNWKNGTRHYKQRNKNQALISILISEEANFILQLLRK